MLGLSLYDRFKSLDVYRKLPSDFVQPTYSGAMRKYTKITFSYCLSNIIPLLVSMVSSVIMVLLFLSEFSSYREIKTASEMFIDVNRGGEKVIYETFNLPFKMSLLQFSSLSMWIWI